MPSEEPEKKRTVSKEEAQARRALKQQELNRKLAENGNAADVVSLLSSSSPGSV